MMCGKSGQFSILFTLTVSLILGRQLVENFQNFRDSLNYQILNIFQIAIIYFSLIKCIWLKLSVMIFLIILNIVFDIMRSSSDIKSRGPVALKKKN